VKRLSCPHCGERISPLRLQTDFSCQACGTRLRGKIVVAMLGVLALWSLADLIVMLATYTALPGRDDVALLVHLVVSIAVGGALFMWCFPAWASVSRIP
jgi:hypothetical protein